MISEIFNGGFFSKRLGYGQSSLEHFKASDFRAGKGPFMYRSGDWDPRSHGSMGKSPIPVWRSLTMLHSLSQIPDSNAYSQGQGDISDDGDPYVNAFAIRSQFHFDFQDAGVNDVQPVWKPQFLFGIPWASHGLNASLRQHQAEHLGLTTLVFAIALFRGLTLSMLWHGIRMLRQM